MATLAGQVYAERLKCLEGNEKYIAKGFEDDDSDEEDEDGFVDEEEENPDQVFKDVKK